MACNLNFFSLLIYNEMFVNEYAPNLFILVISKLMEKLGWKVIFLENVSVKLGFLDSMPILIVHSVTLIALNRK